MNNSMEQQKSENTMTMKDTISKEDMQQLKNFIFVSIISADNEEYTEEVKQEVLRRHYEKEGDWEYILDPLGEDKYKYLKIMTT